MSKDKFTDKFFSFPIKIYDSQSLRRAEEMEEANIHMDPDWISGWTKVSYKDLLEGFTWQDGYSNGRTIEEVKEEGFDLTIVYIERYGEYTCTWNRKKFEEKLNDFMEKNREVVEKQEESEDASTEKTYN